MSKPLSRSVAKVRDHRARKRLGLTVLRVIVPEYDIAEYLIETGRLTVAEALDRRRVEHACAEALVDLAARWSSRERLPPSSGIPKPSKPRPV